MTTPYISRRTGSTQWLMQRVSAAVLVVLAFLHFGIQHFTSDAVSTGLTVASRMNNAWWQAYYVLFITLALYHGVNGLVGIIRDYAPPAKWRVLAEVTLWTIALVFGARGLANVVNPTPASAVKESYAARGFPAGASIGNPPSFPISYDFHSELRELFLLEYYLAKHTVRSDDATTAAIFAHKPGAPTPEAVAASGTAFDQWALGVIAKGAPKADTNHHSTLCDPLFSSSYEFAVWAANVRKANATTRGDQAITARLAAAPAYTAAIH